MLEEHKYIATASEQLSDAIGDLGAICHAIVFLSEPEIQKWSGNHLRNYQLLGFRQAQSCLVFLKQSVHRIRQPGCVTEFKSAGNILGQSGEKVSQQRVVAFQCGRKLK